MAKTDFFELLSLADFEKIIIRCANVWKVLLIS